MHIVCSSTNPDKHCHLLITQITNGMRAVMVEMWQSDPNARRGTLNILKNLDGLVSRLPKPEYEFGSRAMIGSSCTPSQTLT